MTFSPAQRIVLLLSVNIQALLSLPISLYPPATAPLILPESPSLVVVVAHSRLHFSLIRFHVAFFSSRLRFELPSFRAAHWSSMVLRAVLPVL